MKIVLNKKKDPWGYIQEHSGSHTISGFQPSTGKKTEINQTNTSNFLALIDRLVSKADFLAGRVFSAYSGGAKYNELKQIMSELESLKCKDLGNSATFRRCQEKYREISKRLDKLSGLP